MYRIIKYYIYEKVLYNCFANAVSLFTGTG